MYLLLGSSYVDYDLMGERFLQAVDCGDEATVRELLNDNTGGF